MSILKSKYFIIIAAVLAGLLVFVFMYFEPHKLFIDEKSSEVMKGEVFSLEEETAKEINASNESATSTTVPMKSQWRSREHKTSGDVLLTKDNETVYVRFEKLKTDNGPDLKVYIAKDLQDDGTPIDFVNLGDLKANIGDANYAVPKEINIADYNYVIIWCKRFSVSFADAEI